MKIYGSTMLLSYIVTIQTGICRQCMKKEHTLHFPMLFSCFTSIVEQSTIMESTQTKQYIQSHARTHSSH